MVNLLDLVAVLTVRFITFFVRLFPKKLIHNGVYFLLRIFLFLKPKYISIAMRNLEIAFPQKEERERELIFSEHVFELARFISDSLFLETHTKDFFMERVSFPKESEFRELCKNSKTGIIYASGHLGCFELYGQYTALCSRPLSFVVRNFKLPRLDRWWCGKREHSGNTVINRKGAYKQIVKTLRSGRDAGVLFDQNIVADLAVFVPWFSMDAATTKAVALAGLQTNAPIIVSALCYNKNAENNKEYTHLLHRCHVEEIYSNTTLSKEEKVREITALISLRFTELIQEYPAQWFWFHRRWKTREDGTTLNY